MMTKYIAVLTASVVVMTMAAFGQKTTKESTVIGDIVDIKSYIAYGMKADNADRKAAIEASIAAGNPLGILEKSSGKIYVVVMPKNENANASLKEYLGVHVYVKGVVYRKAGLQLIIMSDIGKSIK